MYKHFFGLRENPFNVNPDPRYLFFTPQTQDALNALTFGIRTRKGLTVLTGEAGTGKTTLINCLLEWLHQRQTPTTFIFNPRLETRHLFDFILAGFGVSFDLRASSNPLMCLNEWLLERYGANENAVLIVDEAQGLSFDLLEEIRLLLNLETPREKLFQVVLVGQPELEEKLMRHELRQLRQRITLRCKTAPLTPEETHAYIQARLRIAGLDEKPIFTPEAIDALHFYAQGIPRVINLLSEHSLINAYVENIQPVPAGIVDAVANEFQLDHAKHPVPGADFEEVAASQSMLWKSTLTKAPLPVPSATEPIWEAQSARGSGSASVPFLVKEPAILNGESSLSSSACERTSQRVTLTEADKGRLLGSSEFTSEDAFRLLCELALKSKTLTSAPCLIMNGPATQAPQGSSEKRIRNVRSQRIRWSACWTMRWPSIAPSLGRTQIISSLLHWLKPMMNQVQLTHRRWRAWWVGTSSVVKSMGIPEMTAFLIRWLQEPWGEMPGCLRHPRAIHVHGQSGRSLSLD